MPELTVPTVVVKDSFLAAMDELIGEGRGGVHDDSMLGRQLREFGATWSTDAGFAAYVADLRAQALPETLRRSGWVPATTWWYLDGEHYFGRIDLRHELNHHLREVGGHIGYDVRPSARRLGYATAMLQGVLPYARGLGIDSVLLTCDDDNVGSRKVIESAGGGLEEIRNGKRRYWVPTA